MVFVEAIRQFANADITLLQQLQNIVADHFFDGVFGLLFHVNLFRCKGTAFVGYGCGRFYHICSILWFILPQSPKN